MSDFIPKAPSPKTTGLGPKAQKLAALREKAAAAASGSKSLASATSAAGKVNTTGARKTNFQRKAT